ncbi:MAG: hypothetical protein IPH04_12245 [Saprospirales bacterium]|nr:hypothetical protein [Saprospirales bacterium]
MNIRILPILTLLLLSFICISCGHYAQQPASRQGRATITDTIPPLREQIYLQVRNGNTTEALALLEKTGHQAVPLFKDQFQRAHKDFSMGLTSFEDHAITLARIHYAILEYTPGETDAGNAAGVPKDQVRKLAEEGELEAALQMLLPAFEKDATLQLARLHSTEKYFQQGLVTEAEWSREKLKIKFAILELAE